MVMKKKGDQWAVKDAILFSMWPSQFNSYKIFSMKWGYPGNN